MIQSLGNIGQYNISHITKGIYLTLNIRNTLVEDLL